MRKIPKITGDLYSKRWNNRLVFASLYLLIRFLRPVLLVFSFRRIMFVRDTCRIAVTQNNACQMQDQ